MNRTRPKISPVLNIARGLGMPVSGDPVAYLIAYCRRAVDRWVQDYGPRSLRELLETAAAKIGVIIEEVHQDWDLSNISQRYFAQGEGGFACIASELDQRTFALAIRLRHPRKWMHPCGGYRLPRIKTRPALVQHLARNRAPDCQSSVGTRFPAYHCGKQGSRRSHDRQDRRRVGLLPADVRLAIALERSALSVSP